MFPIEKGNLQSTFFDRKRKKLVTHNFIFHSNKSDINGKQVLIT